MCTSHLEGLFLSSYAFLLLLLRPVDRGPAELADIGGQRTGMYRAGSCGTQKGSTQSWRPVIS